MRASLSLAASALLAFAACGPGGGDDGDDDPVGSIIVSPGDVTLTVVNDAEVTQSYTAVFRSEDGEEEDITNDVTWSIPETSVGYFSGTVLHANGAGRGTVTATLDGRTGTAVVEVFREDVRVGDGVDPTVPELFEDATDDPTRLAAIVYPANETIVPPNLGDFDVHWRDTTGSDVYEIRIQTYYADVRVYVTDPAAATTGAWLAFLESEWSSVAHSEIGAALDVTVRGLTLASPATTSHAGVIVHTSREDMNGGIYYWAAASSSGTPDGIYRHDMGRPGEPAEQFFTRTEAGRCVACHVISRDGTKMALTYDGGDQSATVLDVATRVTSIPVATQYWNFAAFTPDGAQLLTARQGALQLRDPASGAVQVTVPTSGYSTHPDISAQGDRIVYVRPTGPGSDWSFTGGQLVTQTFDQAAQTFGGEVPLVSSSDNNYYPSFSPDGQWVLFNRATGGSYDQATAELWVVKTDGSVGPIKLSLSNVGAGLTNSWARWAPFESSFGQDAEPIYWLTFSSKRDFGVRLVGLNRPQIWMTPFFPARAEAGADPTAPAFHLPFQDKATSNHIAQWTTQVVPIE